MGKWRAACTVLVEGEPACARLGQGGFAARSPVGRVAPSAAGPSLRRQHPGQGPGQACAGLRHPMRPFSSPRTRCHGSRIAL